jgi:hypothetical protein
VARQQSLSSHYLSQKAVYADLEQKVHRLWPSLDVQHLGKSLPGFTDQAGVLVRHYGRASQSLASRHYLNVRRSHGLLTRFTVPHVPPPPRERLEKSLGWATEGLWTDAVLAGDPSATELINTALIKTTGTLQRAVADQGRQVITESVSADPRATAWARATSPGCCDFCAMLADRGAVYSDETADFESHDHCQCSADPIFG